MGKVEQGKGNQRYRVGLIEKVTLEPSPVGRWVEGTVLQAEGMARTKALMWAHPGQQGGLLQGRFLFFADTDTV